ncbi:MAG: fumarylacetoacetate hydrolase family protein [Intrasporangium sp.]|uniref:fumarylacetoacetate hydrolase family protein n=1 Tax=Intrasporangium sp. TaxID=1925024 RepID=UPI003F7FA831
MPPSANIDLELASAAATLPADGDGTLIGRVWDPAVGGPSPVIVLEGQVHDLSAAYPTVRDLCEEASPATAARAAAGARLASLSQVLENTRAGKVSGPRMLAPVDLQSVKAAGVTFAVSMLERVIEERVKGDLQAAASLREQIVDEIGADIGSVTPGSEDAHKLKAFLIDRGLWSQYLEVGIGVDAEIFTKAPTLAAVGTLCPVGVPPDSTWNNPEPEVALVISSRGAIVGATLGNDVNLRDVEGRSALLLPQAKDNNASCALGPFLRLFDDTFGLEDVRSLTVDLEISGTDGFRLHDSSPMSQISRRPEDLVAQLFRSHQYPDGALLMLGTLFAPVVDRDTEGLGFTHHQGDVVRISSPQLGALVNEVRHCHDCDPWSFGLRDLMANLAGRQLL